MIESLASLLPAENTATMKFSIRDNDNNNDDRNNRDHGDPSTGCWFVFQLGLRFRPLLPRPRL